MSLYSVAIYNLNGDISYLTNIVRLPKVDTFEENKRTRFLSDCYTSHVQKFSSKEKAQEAIDSLRSKWFRDRVFIIPIKEDKLPARLYYRLVKTPKDFPIFWMQDTGDFDPLIEPNTITLTSLTEVKEYFDSHDLDEDVQVAEVVDYGPPTWEFDYTVFTLDNIENSPSLEEQQ
jgi:hypothetical protein